MNKDGFDKKLHKDLSEFYNYLKHRYRFPDGRIRGIIACTGVILKKFSNISINRNDIDNIKAYMKSLRLTKDTIDFYITSIEYYISYIEHTKNIRTRPCRSFKNKAHRNPIF